MFSEHLYFHGQLSYFLLCCNFRGESQMWRIGNRKRFALPDTKEGMNPRGENSLKLTLKEKKSVEFAWRWTGKSFCLTALIHCVWSVIETGKCFGLFFLSFLYSFQLICIQHIFVVSMNYVYVAGEWFLVDAFYAVYHRLSELKLYLIRVNKLN